MAGFFKKLFGGGQQEEAAPAAPAQEAAPELVKSVLAAHMSGQVLELSKIDEPMFASGALGPGTAIEPTHGQVLAPADGEITVAFPTGHAFGLRTADGLELLIHVGFDTVELDGKFFSPKVEKGAQVKKGDVLVEADLDGIKEAGYAITTPLVVTNYRQLKAEAQALAEQVAAGDDLLEVSRPA